MSEQEQEQEQEQCPTCEGPTEMGFGLAFGGYGAYRYCLDDSCPYFEKWQESDE